MMPCVPMAAMKAKASGMPPSCAATADHESVVERSHLGRLRLFRLSASSSPMIPPRMALVAASARELMNAVR